MNFALLGIDRQTRPLVDAIFRDGQHRLVAAFEVGSETEWLAKVAPQVPVDGQWESLIGSTSVDAVIVASAANEESRAEQLRKLAQAGTPMLIAHPAHSSLLVYYELDMIRQDSGCRIVPLLVSRLHPAVRRIAQITAARDASEFGTVQQVIVDRAVADRSSDGVLSLFARDVDLAAALCGDLTEISAMTSTGASGDYANLGVQMSGSAGIVARWSVAGIDPNESVRLTLRGDRGQAVLQMPGDGTPWKLTTVVSGETREEVFSDWDPAAAMLNHIASALQGNPTSPNWEDAVRAMELSDSIEISLRRGRTIQLHHGQATEEGTFKGMMASAGCGLLILGLMVSVGGLLLMWLEVPGAAAWPYVVFAAFVLFLLLQLLKLAFSRDRA